MESRTTTYSINEVTVRIHGEIKDITEPCRRFMEKVDKDDKRKNSCGKTNIS